MNTTTGALNSITVDTGVRRLTINNDPERVIVFNPTDLNFVERFYSLVNEFEAKLVEYRGRAEEVESHTDTDSHGIPLNTPDRLQLMRETCEFIRSKIDELFGDGTSQVVFGSAMALDAFAQFFTGITPYITSARNQRMEKYIQRPTAGKRRAQR